MNQTMVTTTVAVIVAIAVAGALGYYTGTMNSRVVTSTTTTTAVSSTTTPVTTTGVSTTTAVSSTTTPVTTAVASVPKPVVVALISEGHEGGLIGPDGKQHDTIMPANFTVYVGQKVNLTVWNFDEGPHTITSIPMGLNFQFPGAKGSGVPSTTTFQFTPTKAGVYRWFCALPCDAGQGGWAMTNGKDGQVGQINFMGGFITVLS